MKHTLESLLELAKTDEGRQQIRVIVAELVGKQVVFYGYDYQYMGDTFHAGRWATREAAEMVRSNQVRLKWTTSEIKEVLITDHLPKYDTSLDAIMPEVRKLNEDQQNRWINVLADIIDPMGELGWRADFAIATAEAVHHCIAFILTKQQ